MRANKISHRALVGFSCFAPLVFHFFVFVLGAVAGVFAGLAVTGKNEGGERSFFLSEQLTAELTWLTIES